jgi:hypothetical protein
VLLYGQLGWLDIDLLDDQGQTAVEAELTAAARAGIQGVLKEMPDLLDGEQGALVPGMSGLAATLALVLSRRRRRGRLDDVGRGRLGGSRGVLACCSQLLLEASHGSLQLLQLSALCLQLGTLLFHLRLQALAPGTGIRCCFCHASGLYPGRFNGYPRHERLPQLVLPHGRRQAEGEETEHGRVSRRERELGGCSGLPGQAVGAGRRAERGAKISLAE